MSRTSRISSLTRKDIRTRLPRVTCAAISANRTTNAMLARGFGIVSVAGLAIQGSGSHIVTRTIAASLASKATNETIDTIAALEVAAMPACEACISMKAELATLVTLCALAHLAKNASVARRVELAQRTSLAMLPTRACVVALTLIARIWKSPGLDGTETMS
jgi:hypothetical protein